MHIGVKQGIEKIMDFVTITVHPKNTVNLDLSETGLKTLLDTNLIDIESIKRYLVASLLNLENQGDVESLVQNYQSLIIRLLNDLYTYQSNQIENTNLISLYSSLSELLAEVLSYIETYFARYFNIDEDIPLIHYSLSNYDFQQHLSELHIQFKDRSEDLELFTMLISHYFLSQSSLNRKTITYRDLMYRQELVRELNGIFSDSSVYKSVKDVLLIMNFNHIEFFKYLIDKLQEEYKKLETADARLTLLKYQRKLFRQMDIKPNFALFSQFHSIKEQVLNWIEEEIIFVESQIKPIDQEPEKKDIEPGSESKISVSLSVAQLAFLIRVLILGKVITNNNQSDVIRVFASNFKTHKTEDISFGSLYGKYFKPETSAIATVKGILFQLASLITKMKG